MKFLEHARSPDPYRCATERLLHPYRDRATTAAMPTGPVTGWLGWYRFAREVLGYAHDEAVTYANVRYVEETNRANLRSRDAA